MPPPSSGHPLNEYTVDENGFLIRRDKLNNGNGHPEDYQSEVYNFFRKERHKNSQEAVSLEICLLYLTHWPLGDFNVILKM